MRYFFSIVVFTILLVNDIKATEQKKPVAKCSPFGASSSQCYVDELKNYIDDKVDPCEDFDKYVCRKWRSEDTRESGNWKTTYGNLKDTFKSKILNTDSMALKKAKQLYQQCMDIGTINAVGNKPLLDAIETFGGFPIKTDPDNKLSWLDLLKKMRSYGWFDSFFVDYEYLNRYYDYAHINHQSLKPFKSLIGDDDYYGHDSWLLRDYNKDLRESYIRNMPQVILALKGIKEDDDSKSNVIQKIKNDMKEVYEFEREISKLQVTTESVFDTFDKVIKEDKSGFNWDDYLKISLGELGIPTSVVNVRKPYCIAVADLIMKTDNRIVMNYMMWNFIYKSLQIINDSTLHQRRVYSSRNQFCEIQLEDTPIDAVLSKVFIDKYWNKTQRDEMEGLLNTYLIPEMQTMMNKTNWMGAKNSENIVSKLKQFKLFLAFSDDFNDENINDYLSSVKVHEKNFMKSIYTLKKAKVDNFGKYFNQTGKEWSKFVKTYATYNLPDFKHYTMIVPAGALTGMFYNPRRAKALNFASLLGVATGKDIFKVLNFTSEEFAGDKKLLDEKKLCFINQYNNMKEPGTNKLMYLSGNRTMRSNFLDNAAVATAYQALLKYLVTKEGKTEEDNVCQAYGYTQKQLFWIGYALTNCHKEFFQFNTPESRTIGVVMNMEEFASDFKCASKAHLNPSTRCEIFKK